MEKQDGQIAHGPIVTSWRNPRNAKEWGIRHAQAQDRFEHETNPLLRQSNK
jgi:hypothetical protein